MVYKQFLTAVKERMEYVLGSEYKLILRKIPKNNGIVLDGLCIMRGDSNIAPAIYLNTCYQNFQSGIPMEEIIAELLTLYHSHQSPPHLELYSLASYESVKDRIAFKLIHSQANRKLLNTVPHIEWLDLALVFYVCMNEDEDSLITSLIHNEHLTLWNISLEDLKDQAFSNTPRLFPSKLTSMSSLLEPLEQKESQTETAAPFFILSNTSGMNGAGSILYNHTLKHFADTIGGDVIILPSSVHEVLLLPDTGNISYSEMRRLVAHINESEVPEEDRLSNEVYVYSRSLDSISIASDIASEAGAKNAGSILPDPLPAQTAPTISLPI